MCAIKRRRWQKGRLGKDVIEKFNDRQRLPQHRIAGFQARHKSLRVQG
jgi:hypothetical protein